MKRSISTATTRVETMSGAGCRPAEDDVARQRLDT